MTDHSNGRNQHGNQPESPLEPSEPNPSTGVHPALFLAPPPLPPTEEDNDL